MNMKITLEQAEKLRKLFPQEAEHLLEQGDAMKVLDALDDLYLDLLDDAFEPTEAARECERLRDHIHWANFHKEEKE